jgi:hypothetical protein
MLGLGMSQSLADLARLPRGGRAYTPATTEADAEHALAGWRDAVRRVL